jgi:hypothetical protein
MADTNERKYERVARRAPERGPGFVENYFGLIYPGPPPDQGFPWPGNPYEDADDGPEQGRAPRLPKSISGRY